MTGAQTGADAVALGATAPRRRATVAGVALSAVVAVWLAMRWMSAARHLVVVPSVLVPFAVVPALTAVALLLWARARLPALAAGIVAAAVVATQIPLYVGSASSDGAPLVVLQLNMRFGRADPAAVLALAAQSHADVVTLEEMTQEGLDGLSRAGITTAFPHSFVAPHPAAEGIGVFSRYPLTETRLIESKGLHSTVTRIDRGLAASSPLLFTTHVPAPWPAYSGQWGFELRQLAQQVSATSGPLIVAGDFNSTFDQAPFRRLLADARLSDAGVLTGAGWLPTFPANRALPPIIAIDHILVRGLGASEVHTVTVPGTDHRAVVATLRLN